jgi:hypothetical protein
LRRQVRTAMIFNGHTAESIDALDEETFAELQVMYADGLLGNKGIFEAIKPLTIAVFNYMRSPNAPAYKIEQLFPWVDEYEKNPDNEPDSQQAVSSALLGFVAQAKGFKMERFKNVN